MADREPSTIEVIQRKLDLIARALTQPAYARTEDFRVDWAKCATEPVSIVDEDEDAQADQG